MTSPSEVAEPMPDFIDVYLNQLDSNRWPVDPDAEWIQMKPLRIVMAPPRSLPRFRDGYGPTIAERAEGKS